MSPHDFGVMVIVWLFIELKMKWGPFSPCELSSAACAVWTFLFLACFIMLGNVNLWWCTKIPLASGFTPCLENHPLISFFRSCATFEAGGGHLKKERVIHHVCVPPPPPPWSGLDCRLTYSLLVVVPCTYNPTCIRQWRFFFFFFFFTVLKFKQ